MCPAGMARFLIQVFFLKSRDVGRDARSVRHSRLRLGDGVQDDHVEEFAPKEYVPTIEQFTI